MAVIPDLFSLIFGSDRNVLRETVEVFRENAEGNARREQEARSTALDQFATEFRSVNRSGFDRLMDGINRLPRPIMALGTCGLFVCAMADPVWFATRMQGLTLVPQPLWWLLGVVVSFYFGARHQVKSQEFQKQMVQAALQIPALPDAARPESEVSNSRSIAAAGTGGDAAQTLASVAPDANAALDAWKRHSK
ncbi:hypothetical protein PH5382_02671 [Phaeobacter sp. CECT 5382]|uniref:holin family protein n=1 Tax=Phaeobacter sp. CECT 5382 TaxID=1712645 RepID=UPI0006DBCD0C|nr:holin family protein [Phaeobacter sp. CECT 5382]CUH88729.1 hypothetical protein PH5382_02671 [Phaeobacter sp. CECT 5382]